MGNIPCLVCLSVRLRVHLLHRDIYPPQKCVDFVSEWQEDANGSLVGSAESNNELRTCLMKLRSSIRGLYHSIIGFVVFVRGFCDGRC